MKPEAFILANEVLPFVPGFVLCNASLGLPVVEENTKAGRFCILCGAGPSLAAARGMIKEAKNADIWACNRALNWLVEEKLPVTHAVAIEPRPVMAEVWKDAPDVEYLLASSCHPHLVQHLLKLERRVRFFHAFFGMKGEYEIYSALFPRTLVAGEGLNVVNRALGVALWAGYKRIYVVGADCAFGPQDQMHVGKKGNPMPKLTILQGEIDGKLWRTRPDMAYSAVTLVRQWRANKRRIRLIGDTLPNALAGKPDSFLDQCARWATREEIDEIENLEELRRQATNADELDKVRARIAADRAAAAKARGEE